MEKNIIEGFKIYRDPKCINIDTKKFQKYQFCRNWFFFEIDFNLDAETKSWASKPTFKIVQSWKIIILIKGKKKLF